MNRGDRQRDLACAALLSGIAAVFVLFVYGAGYDNDVFRSYDFREISTYHKTYYRSALLAGRLPLWTPHTFSGWPFAADPITQTFYPSSLLALAMPMPIAVLVDLTIHLALAAVGTYLVCRLVFTLARTPAVFGAIVYAFSGIFVANGYAGKPHYWAACAYLPLVFLAVDQSIAGFTRGQTRSQPAGGGRTGGSGYRWLWLGGLALGLQLLSGGVPFAWLGLLFVALYRCGEVVRRGWWSGRAWGLELTVGALIIIAGIGVAAVQLLPTYELAQLCNRIDAGYEYAASDSFPPHLLPMIVLPGAPVPLQQALWECYGYVGVLPALLAVAAVVCCRREPRVLLLAMIAGLAVLFMLGDHAFLFPLLWKYVPFFGLFRAPGRAVYVLDFIVALLAAIGLNVVVAEASRRLKITNTVLRALVLLACACTVLDVTVRSRANRQSLFIPDNDFTHKPVPSQLAETLRADRSWYRFWFERRLFRENEAYALDARSVAGYDNMYLERHSRFIHFMTDTKTVRSLVTILTQKTFANATSPFPFKVLGVKYATYGGALVRLPPAEAVRRAWFVTRVRRVADEMEALEFMRSDRFEPYHEVIFEAPEADRLGMDDALTAGPPAAEWIEPEITVTEGTPEHLRITLGAHPDGYLVLSEIFFPGWHARSGGEELPIHRADSILRSVRVRADQSEIDMEYSPATVAYGALISAVTLLLALGGFWRRARNRPTAMAS